ncbi:MAG: hypothetical protein N3E38_02180 [Candidatus Aenigmarchaeota archaeon]|nr:hypothetical protein [Candidatus Aenigmarchaeota archaeon]
MGNEILNQLYKLEKGTLIIIETYRDALVVGFFDGFRTSWGSEGRILGSLGFTPGCVYLATYLERSRSRGYRMREGVLVKISDIQRIRVVPY